MSLLAERLRPLPAVEVLAADPEVRFALRAPDPAGATRHLADALRAAGYGALHLVEEGGRAAIAVDAASYATAARVQAFACAVLALGAVAARGHAVPAAVVASLRADGLPAYIGFAGLWRLEANGLEIPRLGPLLDARVAANGADADALMDTATLLFLTLMPENRNAAFTYQRRALQVRQAYRLPARGEGAPLRLLSIAGPGDMTANTPVDCLLDDAPVELTTLYLEPGRPLPAALPPHDAVFVAIGESAESRALLERATPWTAGFAAPVLNRPERILQMSRERVAALLGGEPGVEMPATAPASREALAAVASGARRIDELLPQGAFPVIARPVGSQGGKGLERLPDAAALAGYLREAPENEFYVARFVDYRSADGFYRKYRVVFVEGRPYACHMAISQHWMIHYVNADMDASEAKRAEEARFLADFDSGFGARHAAALARVHARLGLDYFGIDCAEAPDGRLLVFEADAALLVHDLDPPDLYPYKGPQMRRIFGAFVEMLRRAARRG